ncbi:hypothetical protein BT96DRAFT_920920 [Gymnopus androsaceus JB14]|uniref:Uncharacterized protein n=1 Tax=Gymnopus androsaceus JB14 TaxID=1447944 RepID=A0A6A4HJT7_9AGAR|nr:hypothetical protein BT96DRAFT_920920 [Gymnopus androsaceus JB14]
MDTGIDSQPEGTQQQANRQDQLSTSTSRCSTARESNTRKIKVPCSRGFVLFMV